MPLCINDAYPVIQEWNKAVLLWDERVDGISRRREVSYSTLSLSESRSLMRTNTLSSIPRTKTNSVLMDGIAVHIVRLIFVGITIEKQWLVNTYSRLACAIRPRRSHQPKVEFVLDTSQSVRHPRSQGSGSASKWCRSLHSTPSFPRNNSIENYKKLLKKWL